jgi:glycosyltransferase involved in cell wall biosynthesis
MHPSVSVIIPTFNRPRWLRAAIESVRCQSLAAVEAVVVDDGSSTEAAQAIATEYSDVRYIWQENRGLGGARNTGLQHSTGDYVAFLDDDDWLTPDALAPKAQILAACPESGFVYSDLYLTKADGSVLGNYYANRRRPMPEGDIYAALLRRNFIPVHAVLWRRSILEAVGGFPQEGRGVEDWNLLIRAAEQTEAKYVNQALGYYRLHGQNMSLDQAAQTTAAGLTQTHIAQSERFRRLPAAFRARVLGTYAREQWLYGDPGLGRKMLRLAQAADPLSLHVPLVLGLMMLGRPAGRQLMRWYWKLRASLRQPSAADYFLTHT